jgi:hypothetical protein
VSPLLKLLRSRWRNKPRPVEPQNITCSRLPRLEWSEDSEATPEPIVREMALNTAQLSSEIVVNHLDSRDAATESHYNQGNPVDVLKHAANSRRDLKSTGRPVRFARALIRRKCGTVIITSRP